MKALLNNATARMDYTITFPARQIIAGIVGSATYLVNLSRMALGTGIFLSQAMGILPSSM